jgi:hypothetical protein
VDECKPLVMGPAGGQSVMGTTVPAVVRIPEQEPDELSTWLKAHKLDSYEAKLRSELGGAFVEDLVDMKQSDWEGLG